MRNKLLAFTAICSVILSSCGDSSTSGGAPADNIVTTTTASSVQQAAKINYDDPEIVPVTIDYVFLPPEETIEKAEIIMIGEYLDDNSNTNTYYIDPNNKTGSGIEQTFNTIKAVQVFKGGELVKDGKVDIFHNYAFVLYPEGNTKLVLNSLDVPMYKGDRAIFLLAYNEKMQRYSAKRLPLPENKDKPDKLGFKNGIRNDVEFDQALYDLLLKKYDIK